MTTKRPSELAAGGPADDPDSDQITKEHNDDGDGHSITIDPSEDVTVEATEDVTTEAVPHTPPPSLRPGTVGVSAAQRAPTLLGVPIQSLPLPGVTAASAGGETTRQIDTTTRSPCSRSGGDMIFGDRAFRSAVDHGRR
jgi:hypothetical protein